MAIHASKGKVYGHGIDLSTVLKSFSTEWGVETADSTVLASTGREHQTGMKLGNYSGEGLVSETPGELYDIIKDALGSVDNPIVHLPLGDTAGYPMVGLAAVHTKAGFDAMTDAVSWAKVEGDANYGTDLGVVLRVLSTSTGTVNGASYDAGAASTNGGIAYLVATAFTGTNVTFKLQHSTNNSAWSDLATFTDVEAAGAERLVVAEGTTVHRYRRIAITGGTFTSVTAFSGFAAK